MSEQERHAEIGRAYQRYRDSKRRVAGLECKLGRIKRDLKQLADRLDKPGNDLKVDGAGVLVDSCTKHTPVHDAAEIREVLQEHAAAVAEMEDATAEWERAKASV